MSITDAVEDGRIATLRALRGRLATELDVCKSGRDVAALANRLQDVLRELDELEPPVVQRPKTPLDELNERRESKRKTG